MRRILLAVAVLLAVLTPAAPAWAHAKLVAADPAPDATLTAAPTAVTLEFSEQLNPDFTTIVVSDTARQRVPAAAVTVDRAFGRLPLTGSLSNGVYTVAYRVVSVDGHTVEGSYIFTLADPDLPPAAPAVAVSSAPPPLSEPDGGVSGGLLIGLCVAGVVLVGAGGYLLRYRRRALAGG